MKCLPKANKAVQLVALLALSLVALPHSALAGGLGAYLENSHGEQTISLAQGDDRYTNTRFGLGIVLDTNVARNELLNVRASVGYRLTENDVDEEYHGGVLDLAVGLGFWRSPKFRVWAAPSIRVDVDYSDSELARVLDLGFGGGARLGVNWHFSRRISVSPSIGYHFRYVRQTFKEEFAKDVFHGTEHLVTARLTFLFRDARDVFRSRRQIRSRGR